MNYCPEIHHGLFLHTSGIDGVSYGPCCQSGTVKIDNDSFDFNNSDFLNRLRQENLQGIQSPECIRCWQGEDIGNKSKRQSSLEFPIRKQGLEIFEYNVNWACNLACIMCSPNNSSTWAKELGITDNKNQIERRKNHIIDQLDLSNLKRIHFNGGEPLINNDHVRVLEKIDDISGTKITYNTNGTQLPSNDALKCWEKSQVVRLFFSIDAVGKSFEYIRYPGKWDQILKNLDWYVKNSPSNVLFGLNVAFGAYNVLEAVDLYNWFEQCLAVNRDGDKSDFCWQVVYNFDYKYLPDPVKQDVLNKLEGCKPLESLYNSVMSTLNTIPNDNWIQKLNEIDSRRGTCWQNSLKIGEYYK